MDAHVELSPSLSALDSRLQKTFRRVYRIHHILFRKVQETSLMHYYKRHLRNRNLRGSDRESLLSHLLPSSSESFISVVRSVASTLWRSVFPCVSSRSSFRSRSSRRRRRWSAQSFFDNFEKDNLSLRTSRRSEDSEEQPEPPILGERGLREERLAEPSAEHQPGPPTGSPPTPDTGSYPEFPPPEYGKDHESLHENYEARYAEAGEIWKKRDGGRGHEYQYSAEHHDGDGPSGRPPSGYETFDLFAKNEPEEEAISDKPPAYDGGEKPPKYRRGFRWGVRERLAAFRGQAAAERESQ